MEKLTKQILIGLAPNDQCAISISPDMDAATAMQLVGTLALHILNAFKAVAEDDINTPIVSEDGSTKTQLTSAESKAAIQGITDSLYDAMDSVFSSVLVQFCPEHPRYSLEDEAIIELTNKKIEEAYNALTPEQKSRYSQAYNKMKLQAQFRKETAPRANSETSKTTTED